jgi:hypothetical protein
MDHAAIEPAIKIILTEIHSKLSEAARIAKAAEACALAGSVAEGVSVSMDIEQLIYEAGRLQDAASLLNRLSREWLPAPARGGGIVSVHGSPLLSGTASPLRITLMPNETRTTPFNAIPYHASVVPIENVRSKDRVGYKIVASQ